MQLRMSQSIVVAIICLLMILSSLGTAFAKRFHVGEETTIDVDVTVSYDAGWRLQDPDRGILAAPNQDDGTRNFDKGDMITNKFSALADIDLNYKNIGVFARPRAFYDFVYMGDNAQFDDPDATPNSLPDAPNEFPDKTRDRHGNEAEVLDLFAYGSFALGHRNLDIRVGRQVISWGESLFIPGGISSAQSPVDATIANAPGLELKELFLPTESVYGQLMLTSNISLGAYYQWKWRKTRIPESGSYFSTADFLDDAGEFLFISTPMGSMALPRGKDQDPRDDGQYGVSLFYFADWLAQTEFGLYFINYHEKQPMLNIGFMDIPAPPFRIPANYYLSYAEDVNLYGASVSSLVRGVNVSGEVSYRRGYMARVNAAPGAPGYEKADVLQAQISPIYTRPFYLMDDLVMAGEVAFNRVSGTSSELENDKTAWGYTIALTPKWYQVLPTVDLSLPLKYSDSPKGDSSVTGSFVEKARSFSAGVSFLYRNSLFVGLNYVVFSGNHSLSDRDYISTSVKYTF